MKHIESTINFTNNNIWNTLNMEFNFLPLKFTKGTKHKAFFNSFEIT